MNAAPPLEAYDEFDRTYLLEHEALGEGGQGAVFRCISHPEHVVKLTSDDREVVRQRLAFVRTLDLPDDLNLARPVALVESSDGRSGYVMKLLQDMVPIRTMFKHESEDVVQHYINTGGLRRRLKLMAHLALQLTRLHGVPLVYADISWDNVFISKALKDAEVWLIDADNLSYHTGHGPVIYTPPFGAPEVVRAYQKRGGAGASTMSDSYAFALLSFWILADVEAFDGDVAGWSQTSSGSPDSGAPAPLAGSPAELGELPWIFDPDDDSNRSDHGMPQEFFLRQELFDLYARTFGPGRQNPAARPGMMHWTKALFDALDKTLTCRKCGLTHLISECCPYCNSPRTSSFLAVYAHRWDPTLEKGAAHVGNATPLGRSVLEIHEDEPAFIRRAMAWPSTLVRGVQPCLDVVPCEGGMRLTARDDGQYTVVSPGLRPENLGEGRVFAWPTRDCPLYIHCGPMEQPHRVLTCVFFEAEVHA